MERRKELGMTQEELATKIGYKSKSTINKIELGINDIPQSKLVLFADALDMPLKQLMGWEEVQRENDVIADIVVRMRTDQEFLGLIEKLYSLNRSRLTDVVNLLNVFLK